ncbi:FeoB-associated Cys-rich membrane protein [Geofilum sp. OHC36d9]|uniref:FeoB-associated Cys-rich membrane protein n=1 Tax=Geofilum sp. OHC36d9 TaxID=3458413 RepID=UPI004034C3B1
MLQEILVYITVAYAIGYAIHGIYRTFRPAPGQSPCSGCGTSGCEAKSLLVTDLHKQKTNNQHAKSTQFNTVHFRPSK